MKLVDSRTLPAGPQAVWAALNDPAVLEATLPGCKSLAMIDERHFESTVQIRVGPAAATFRGDVELMDLEPQRAYTLIGRGNAGPAGFAKVTARVTLEGQGDTTLLRYDADVEIGGKLMSVGARLIQSAAAKNLESFFSAFSAYVERMAASAADGAQACADGVDFSAVSTPTQSDSATRGEAPAARPAETVTGTPAANDTPSGWPGRALWLVGVAAGFAGLVVGFIAGHAV
jgi:uncharacterized protein